MYNNVKFLLFFLVSLSATSQEGIAVYSDYLSDNYYLIHPSMAGCPSVLNGVTGRKQWFDEDELPKCKQLVLMDELKQERG
jgi:hypothetical protein